MTRTKTQDENDTNSMPHRYGTTIAGRIELKWQHHWDQHGTFRTPNPGDFDYDRFENRPKKFILDMFPYPSGEGLHVGHPLGYIATDIYARFLRAKGFHVLHAMGFDAFGLPAEQYAVEHGVHPRVTTETNINRYKAQMRRIGLAYDPDRSFSTTDPDYYRWTQWIFLQIFNAWYDNTENRARPISELIEQFENGTRSPEHDTLNPDNHSWTNLTDHTRRAIVNTYRLAYIGELPVNWCPALGTVLANEEVTAEGKSERGNHPVVKRPLKQWMMRITTYTQRLLDSLDHLDWPEPIKLMQRNWIGRSEGADVDFLGLDPNDQSQQNTADQWFKQRQQEGWRQTGPAEETTIRVYTTRPDTLFGATYMVLAPEHPLVDRLTADQWPDDIPDAWKGRFDQCPTGTPRQVVEAYRRFTQSKSDIERQIVSKDKTGVFIGSYAVNPVNGRRIPIFIADYVLMGYGTGAIMSVPAHDDRDFEFANQFDLEIRDVIHSRLLSTIHAFCRFANNQPISDEELEGTLIDFVGLCISADRDDYQNVWTTIRTRRHSAPSEVGCTTGDSSDDESDIDQLLKLRLNEPEDSESARQHRGSIARIWRETLRHVLEAGDLHTFITDTLNGHLIHRLGQAMTEPGLGVNSKNNQVNLNGQSTEQAMSLITQWLHENGLGVAAINYKLRDWLFSRQRYWGEPFPIVYDEQGEPHALKESDLPVVLPELDDFSPAASDDPNAMPEPPLDRAKDWANITIDGKKYHRETNTMPQWAGSCWYYLRYLDAKNEHSMVDPDVERYWMLTPKSSSTGFQPVRTPPLIQKQRNLPHWQKDGSIYFVTFALKKSGDILTPEERDIVINACTYWHGSRARVYTCVVMPDHVHMIIQPLKKDANENWWTLSELLHSIKRFSATKVNESRGVQGTFWQDESYDRIIRNEYELEEKWEYLRTNPVRKQLVKNAKDYQWLTVPAPLAPHRLKTCATASGNDPHRLKTCATAFDPNTHHWGGVDLYIGGTEHAVLHLLYARFWHKVLYDLGHVSTPEPFQKLFNQGYIQAYAYTDQRGVYVPADEVDEHDGKFTYNGQEVKRSYGKMGKSLKNVVTPDDIFEEYGCDTLRLYEMSMGPLEQSKPWNTRDIVGSQRMLQRVWRNLINEDTGEVLVCDDEPSEAIRRLMNKTIDRVDRDANRLSFNTAIAAITEFNNALVSLDRIPRRVAETLVQLLAPFVPHFAEELWERFGHTDGSIMYAPFPIADPNDLIDDEIQLVVQIMGKVRAKIMIPADTDEQTATRLAQQNDKIAGYLEGKTIRKVIYVPGRLINFVAN